jgi:hypothetical protein
LISNTIICHGIFYVQHYCKNEWKHDDSTLTVFLSKHKYHSDTVTVIYNCFQDHRTSFQFIISVYVLLVYRTC